MSGKKKATVLKAPGHISVLRAQLLKLAHRVIRHVRRCPDDIFRLELAMLHGSLLSLCDLLEAERLCCGECFECQVAEQASTVKQLTEEA